MKIQATNLPRVGPTRVPRRVLASCAAAVATCTAWAFWPLPRRDASPPTPALHERPRTALASLDPEAFRTPIWVAEPPPTVPEKPPPAPPVRLRLVAIVRDSDELLRAILFDPDSNRLITAAAGETIANHLVEAIDHERVTISGQGGVSMLALNSPHSPGGRR